jgi:tetratricopeptide (TPR) repeat protein
LFEFEEFFMRKVLTTLAIFFGVAAQICCAQEHFNSEAVRLNNRGVAQMGQQLTEKARESFAEAFQKDPRLGQAAINEGIASIYLQNLDEAKAALHKGLQIAPGSARGWYNLGLAERADNHVEQSLDSFQHVVAIDPRDADSYYYQGVCYEQMKQLNKAIAMFEKALEVNPLHASSEFALARALQRSGRGGDANTHFKRFVHLTGDKISNAIGLSYGEQGNYSAAEAVEEPETSAGLATVANLGHFEMHELDPHALTDSLTGGACLLDATGEGAMDVVMMSSGSQAIAVLHRSTDRGFIQLDPAATGLQAKGRARACAVGDYDGDGLNDIAIALDDAVLLFRNLGHGRFQNVTAEAGLIPRNRPTGITFVDYDHDGDLDLLLTGSPLAAGGAPTVLWRNNGNKQFTEWTEQTGLGGSGNTSASTLTDFNNDRAVDLAVTGDGEAPLLYVNPREGKYPTQALYEHANLPATIGIAAFDFNKDGWMDIAVTHASAPGLTLWRNVQDAQHASRAFERVALPIKDVARAWGLTPIDIDNDGWIDLAAIVESKAGIQVCILRNRGDGSFEDVTHAMGLDKIKLSDARGLIAYDVDGDGKTDLIVTQFHAAPLLLLNRSESQFRSVRINLTGFADNKTALGAKVEIFAGSHWQKFEIAGASGFGTQGSSQLIAGLGDAGGIDLLRILWPTGVLQDEIDLPHKQVLAVVEADRRGSSCPVLFAWNGHRYALVTDVIGAAVVGHWFTPTRRNTPRPGEWVKVSGEALAPVDGKLNLRFIEPMEEVNYVDQLRLVAVDHPEGVEVNPDERFLDDPPFATGKVIASRSPHLPAGVWDGAGHDTLREASERDHHFASGFTATPYDGFANLHALTIELGNIKAEAPLRLLLTGYVNYFSATSLYAAWQAGIQPVSPYIEAEMPDGSWKRIVNDAGFPAGLERVITVDLTGKLPAHSHRIRLMTNLQIYWDQVLVDDHAQAESRTEEVPIESADLRFHGYPRQIEGASPGDLDYDYNQVSLTGPFQRQRGNYTRMGDVTPLLRRSGDQFVIFGSGEEIAAEFDATHLPALPPHWKRDYFFYADGFVKDMDWWDASPFTVAQLPFHTMSSYPYPANESYPNNSGSLEYQLEWNERFESGDPVRSYRFDYRSLPSTPADHAGIIPGGTPLR